MRPYGPKINGAQQETESTLGEFRELTLELFGDKSPALVYLDGLIMEKGADFEVEDSMAFRDVLTPMFLPLDSKYTLTPLHQHLKENGEL